MQPNSNVSFLVRLQRTYRVRYDATALLVYTAIVYSWGLTIGPLSGDFGLLAGHTDGLDPAASVWLSAQTTIFGGQAWLYHSLNMLLLYICTLCVYGIGRCVIPEGPTWLATLAATLFMANPVHSDDVLHLTGVVDLLPALTGLAAVFAYVYHGTRPQPWSYPVAMALFAAAVLLFEQNFALLAVPLALEVVVLRPIGLQGYPRLLLPLVITGIAAGLHINVWSLERFDPETMFGPLYFMFYPIGFLPETARTFHNQPWWGWLSGLVVVGVLFLVYRKVNRPAFAFGVLAAAGVRLAQGGSGLESVHLTGEANLLAPSAFYSIALAAMFGSMMRHPKWRRPVVVGTTLLALVFFGLQIRAINHWHDAGQMVAEIQTEAMTHERVALIPDVRHCGMAPVGYSEALSYDTPFSEKVEHQILLPLDCVPDPHENRMVENKGSDRFSVRIESESPKNLIPWPYTLAEAGGTMETSAAHIETMEITTNAIVFEIIPKSPGFGVMLPGSSSP